MATIASRVRVARAGARRLIMQAVVGCWLVVGRVAGAWSLEEERWLVESLQREASWALVTI